MNSKDAKGKNMDKYITMPLTAQKVEELHAGDYVYTRSE